MEKIRNLKCIKTWCIDGQMYFKKGWMYPVVDYFLSELAVKGYKVIPCGIEDQEDYVGVWFYTGSEYFEIP